MTQHPIAWDQNSPTLKTMSVKCAVLVRLVACSGNEPEISHQEDKCTFFQLVRCRHQFLREGEYGPNANFNKALGHRCRSLWLSIQELEKQSCQWIG